MFSAGTFYPSVIDEVCMNHGLSFLSRVRRNIQLNNNIDAEKYQQWRKHLLGRQAQVLPGPYGMQQQQECHQRQQLQSRPAAGVTAGVTAMAGSSKSIHLQLIICGSCEGQLTWQNKKKGSNKGMDWNL